jgi:hypothetical protein
MDTTKMDIDTTPISPEIAALEQYLKDREIPTSPEFMQAAGLEYAAGAKISATMDMTFHGEQLGLLIHYPGTTYSTVRLVPGGPICPKGTIPHAYLCPQVNWDKVEGTLVICESPLKALTWAGAGYNAMSAGGTTTVYMPKKKQWCVGFPHASIESGNINTVLLAWDSDTEGMNDNVSRDQRNLARALSDTYPQLKVQIHVLPAPPPEFGKKSWGVDDLHHMVGADLLKAFCADTGQRRDPKADLVQKHFDDLDDQYVVCHMPPRIIDLVNGSQHKTNDFKSLIEVKRQIPTENGRMAAVVPLWLARSNTPTVETVTYSPGQDVLTATSYNIWRPSDVLPRQGSVDPYLSLLNDVIVDPHIRNILMDCMAWQVQNRGKRLPKLIYFCGGDVGTGKSTVAQILAQILGKRNTSAPTKKHIESNFNTSWGRSELAVLDDIEKLGKGTWSMLKTAITSDEILIEQKGIDAAMQDNYCTFYITSNRSDVITTDMNERRVLFVPFKPAVVHKNDGVDNYWHDFFAWLENQGGLEAIAYFLLHRDIELFDPNFEPPMTASKRDAIEAAQDDDTAFLGLFKQYPFEYIPRERTMVTSHELFMLYSGKGIGLFEGSDLATFTRKITNLNVLDKVQHDGVFKCEKIRTSVFWVPGRETRDKQDKGAMRNHIKKYSLRLQQE